MRLRPAPAHWFETYVPRNETVYALEALAATGLVQLELDPKLAQSLDLAQVHRLIAEFQSLRERYAEFLPAQGPSPGGLVEAPETTARKAVERLNDWAAPMDELLQRQLRLEAERQNLLLLSECLTALQETSHDTDTAHLSQSSRFLYKGVFACPRTSRLASDICAAIGEFVPGGAHNFFVVADQPDCEAKIEEAYRSESCLSVHVPAWLSSVPIRQQTEVRARLAEIDAHLRRVAQDLDAKKGDSGIATASADIDLLIWYLEHSTRVGTIRKLCHVTGWTTAEDTRALQQALRKVGVHAVIRFAHPPEFSKTPVSMLLPWWAKPFQFFIEMLGTPDSTEVDPGRLLPLVVPLLFGYMFPDVGHGLTLALFSAALYRRWPAGRFLIPCGLSAALFGVVFGEVFGLGHIVAPLWVRPLEHPLHVLTAPLLFGVGLILLGLVFDGAAAFWRGEAKTWLLHDAAVPVLYAAVLAGLFVTEVLWIAVLALLWFLFGRLFTASTDPLAQVGKNLVLLLQRAFELTLNTLSFLRVGAFALAHAGLSTAVLGLAEAIPNEVGRALMLASGHILIVAIEGLVAFVQTTRLVLFEFFVRFLRADGREFHPIAGPPGKPGAR